MGLKLIIMISDDYFHFKIQLFYLYIKLFFNKLRKKLIIKK